MASISSLDSGIGRPVLWRLAPVAAKRSFVEMRPQCVGVDRREQIPRGVWQVWLASITGEELVDVRESVVQQIMDRHPFFPVVIVVFGCTLGARPRHFAEPDRRDQVVSELFDGV
jgi:hypothetical protein